MEIEIRGKDLITASEGSSIRVMVTRRREDLRSGRTSIFIIKGVEKVKVTII